MKLMKRFSKETKIYSMPDSALHYFFFIQYLEGNNKRTEIKFSVLPWSCPMNFVRPGSCS